MKTETLEALLLDRALGQLSPEVEALLDEHLASHPDAAALAAACSETVSLATAAMHQPARRLALPPRTVMMFPRHRVRRLAALAASFIAGAGVALLGLHGLPSRTDTAATHPAAPLHLAAIAPQPLVRQAEINPSIRTLPFWSTQRAVALAAMKETNHRNTP